MIAEARCLHRLLDARESFKKMLDILNQAEEAAPMSPAKHAYSS